MLAAIHRRRSTGEYLTILHNTCILELGYFHAFAKCMSHLIGVFLNTKTLYSETAISHNRECAGLYPTMEKAVFHIPFRGIQLCINVYAAPTLRHSIFSGINHMPLNRADTDKIG